MKKFLTNNQMYQSYKKMLPYVKPYWIRALIAVFISIPIGSLDAVIALSLKPCMDVVMVEKNTKAAMYIPYLIILFTSLQGFLNYIATYVNSWVGSKITNDIKQDLYKKLLTYETSFFDKGSSGNVVARFSTDADAASAGLLNNLKMFVSRLFSSVTLVGVLIWNSWQLAIIAILVLLCAFAPLSRVRKMMFSINTKNVNVLAKLISIYNETFSGNKTISAYNLDEYQSEKYKENLNDTFSLSMKLIKHTGWLSPLMHVTVSIGIALVVGFGMHLIVTDKITSGNFVSFITALIMLYTPVKTMGNNFIAVQNSFLAIERIFDLFEYQPKIRDKENPINLDKVTQGISYENVVFEYEENRPILKGVSLSVRIGETIALVGNSGGGKTTLVNLLPRFYDIKDGKITVDGIDIKDISLKSLRDKIAVVFQDNFLFEGTIRENILLGNQYATDEQIYNALKNAYLDDFVASLEHGLDTQIGERGVLLSGGQKQRVAIARALLKDAPIVILDEATSALDNKSEAIVQKAIDRLMENRTVFVIAHRLSTVQNATRIAVVNDGNIVELGNHEQLMAIENGIYKNLYVAQFKTNNETLLNV